MEQWQLVLLGTGAGGAISLITGGVFHFLEFRREVARESRASERERLAVKQQEVRRSRVHLRRLVEDYLKSVESSQVAYLDGINDPSEGVAETVLGFAKISSRTNDETLVRNLETVRSATADLLSAPRSMDANTRSVRFKECLAVAVPALIAAFARMDELGWPDE